jgi:hypothetical protein
MKVRPFVRPTNIRFPRGSSDFSAFGAWGNMSIDTLTVDPLNNVGVAVGIAESPEAQQFLAPRIENGWYLA